MLLSIFTLFKGEFWETLMLDGMKTRAIPVQTARRNPQSGQTFPSAQ